MEFSMESYYTENRSCGNQKHVKHVGMAAKMFMKTTENTGNGEDVYGLQQSRNWCSMAWKQG